MTYLGARSVSINSLGAGSTSSRIEVDLSALSGTPKNVVVCGGNNAINCASQCGLEGTKAIFYAKNLTSSTITNIAFNILVFGIKE